MTATMTGPAGRMQIARGLIALRERCGLTQTQVAERAGVSKATVSRYEAWQDRARIRWATVKALADACEASAEEREALVRVVKSQSEGWWVGNSAVPEWIDPLVSFEHEAEYEHVYANNVVPGLLQTRGYATAIHRATELRTPNEQVERMVDARMQRQSILDRQVPLHLWVILDEAVLRRIVGDEAVMAEQMDHLYEMAQRPNVDIQLLPFTAGAHAAGSGHFVILGRDDARNPLNSMAVVYIEMRRRGLYLDDVDAVSSYKLSFDYLRSQAADSTASLRLLGAVRQEFSS
ncbi:helix-turn-helix domain-containing protein [Streptomyces iranensis]|uniref:Helix-turn-helix domain protein n=1 Tax=Streptomyces iranensis TaxID=576784 RepID=A0A060ZN80_9ACTN|nr:helix-turn-helix transcriptional regulator [Streptomyces iranensis]MBP2062500.1 transcriptional regulator with XRE-family HTH domain [Streptomyces iranensis]CDR07291.1 helix-turn-helix domain protein [Streptomyces iranensis]